MCSRKVASFQNHVTFRRPITLSSFRRFANASRQRYTLTHKLVSPNLRVCVIRLDSSLQRRVKEPLTTSPNDPLSSASLPDFCVVHARAACAGPGPAAPSCYPVFHPQFTKNDAGASSTLYLQNPSDQAAYVSLEFYTELGQPQSPNMALVGPHSVLRIAGEDLVDLSNGIYALVACSDQQVESVVHPWRRAFQKG